MFYENKPEFFILYNETTALQYPLHIHSYIEYVHVISGLVGMQISGEDYLLEPGDIALIFPNVPHKYQTLSSVSGIQFYIMNSSVDILPMHKMDLLSKYPRVPVIHPSPLHEDILYAEKRLFELTAKPENTQMISSLTSLILCHIFPMLQLNDFESTPPLDLTSKIIAYIGSNFQDEITLPLLAKKFGVGKYTLSRIFSNVLGISLPAYLNSLRMDYATYLLLRTDMDIINVAMESGYHNQQTFNRIFKSTKGCTPKEYRQVHRQSSVPHPPAAIIPAMQQSRGSFTPSPPSYQSPPPPPVDDRRPGGCLVNAPPPGGMTCSPSTFTK